MAADVGSLADYAASLGSSVADVGSTAATTGLSALGLSNPITLLPSLVSLGLNLAGINPIGDLMQALQGLPANAKPDMFAQYLQGQGGLAGDLGSLISAAQNQAGSGSGVLSQSGANAFNPNFMATLLEALTGQNLGTDINAQGRQVFTAPATGQVQNPVTETFLTEQNLMSSPGMQGLSAYGFTPQQLSSAAALKAIESATNYGDVGTGQGLGTQKVAQYLPKVVAALEAAGITPGGGTSAAPSSTSVGSASDYTSQTPQADTSDTSSTGTGNDLTIPLSTLLSLGTTGTNLANLLNSGTISGNNITLPTSALTKALSSPTSTTQTPSTTTPSVSTPTYGFKQGWSSIGLPRPMNLPQQTWNPIGGVGAQMPTVAPTQVITPAMDMSGVGGGTQNAPTVSSTGQGNLSQLLASLLGGNTTGTPNLTGASPWTVAAG